MFAYSTQVPRVTAGALSTLMNDCPWTSSYLGNVSPVDTVDKAFDVAVKSFNKVGATSEYVTARECKLVDSVSAEDIAAHKYHTYADTKDGWEFSLVIAGD